jgi:hypothetical protein
MTIDDSRSGYYDSLFDQICESLLELNKTSYNELESTLTRDNDAWRKMILKYRNKAQQVIEQADDYFTAATFGDNCNSYKRDYINIVFRDFVNFLRSSLTVYEKYNYERRYEMLAIQQNYVKEWAEKLRKSSSKNKPQFNKSKLLVNKEILYEEMLHLISVKLSETKVTCEARVLLRKGKEQNQIEAIGWTGTVSQLNFIHDKLIIAGFIMESTDFIRHFQIGDEIDNFEENSILPILWNSTFSLLVYLLEELKRKRLIKLGLNFEKISYTHFIKGNGKDKGAPWTGYYQVIENYKNNQSNKPRGSNAIEQIISRMPA